MEKCALCGAILTTVEAGIGPVTYCGRCGVEDPPYLPAYDRQENYITEDGRFQYWYQSGRRWVRFDNQDGDAEPINENDLPFALVPLYEWQERQRAADWLKAQYGEVRQLALAL